MMLTKVALMRLTKAALKKMSNGDIITFVLDCQDKFNSTLANITKDIGELNYKFEKPESKFAVSKSVNSNLCKK